MDFSKKMGSLWENDGKGGKYLKGNITIDGVKHDIICFSNNKRPGKSDPDWQVFPSEPKEKKEEEDPF